MSLKVAADSTITPDPATAWNRRLAEARAAADRADSGLDAAVCDAARAGISPDAIADALDFELDDVLQTIQDDEHDQDPDADHPSTSHRCSPSSSCAVAMFPTRPGRS